MASDGRISVLERTLYTTVRSLTPSTITRLAGLCGLSVAVVSRGCARLVGTGWLTFGKNGREKRPLPAAPSHVQVKQAELLTSLYPMQKHKGEFLMKALLDAHVLSRVFVENARPDWLVNPTTNEPMELDRLYLWPRADSQKPGVVVSPAVPASFPTDDAESERVANSQGLYDPGLKGSGLHGFEFYGPQHFGPTKRYPDKEEAKKLQARDLMKKGICADFGLKMTVVTYKDLSPKGIRRRIPKTLPVGHVDLEGSYMKKLSALCAHYRAHAGEFW